MVGGTNGASVVCFHRRTGQVKWRSQSDIAGYASVRLASLAGRKQVICFTAVGVIGLDPNDGTLLWREPVKTSIGRHIVTPVIAGNFVVVSSHQAGLIGIKISRTGQGLKSEKVWVNKSVAMNVASPVVHGNHLFGVGPEKNILCVDIRWIVGSLCRCSWRFSGTWPNASLRIQLV